MDTKPYKVLIVEKDDEDLEIIRQYLHQGLKEALPVSVKTFKQAEQILSCKETRFDVLLLDLMLNDKNGNELVTSILAIAKCPVIILTGYANLNFSISSISAGIYDYLLKDSLTPSMLSKSILYAIERKKHMESMMSLTQQYVDLFDQSPQPMWVFEADTLKFVRVNHAAMSLFGYSKEEFLALDVYHFVAPDYSLSETLLKNYLDPEYKIAKYQCFQQKKNGDIVEAEVYNNPLMIDGKLHRVTIAIDVTEKNQLEHRITRAIIKAQEDERHEIGSELHDNVCQLLATSLLGIGMIKEEVSSENMQFFDQGKEYIEMSLEEIRKLSHRLVPAFLNTITLEQAFNRLLNSFNIGEKYEINLDFDHNINRKTVADDIQLNLYRILQEQLRNISKYSGAKTINVNFCIHQTSLVMQVMDDGVGFNTGNVTDGIGLTNIRRRAELFRGKTQIISAPGKGCTLRVVIPLI